MTRRALAAYLGAALCLTWAVLTAWAFIHGATRRDDDVPDVQPWDERTVTLAAPLGAAEAAEWLAAWQGQTTSRTN
jgi:hypothetical protein